MFNKHSKTSQSGFTLFELIVAIAVVGLMVGVVVSRVDDWFGVNIKRAANRISSTIRYIHDKATTQNLYVRMVFDFEKNSYWVEATSEQYLLTTKEVEEADKLAEEEERQKEEKEKKVEGEVTAEAGGEDIEGIADTEIQSVKKYRTPQFGAIDEFLLKPVSLPDGVFLKDVYTSHDKGPVSGGQAFIYFFPNGYVEPSIINLKDENDEINYSVEVNPIIGNTYLRDEYKGMEE